MIHFPFLNELDITKISKEIEITEAQRFEKRRILGCFLDGIVMMENRIYVHVKDHVLDFFSHRLILDHTVR